MGGTNGSRVNGGRGRAWAAPPKEAAGRASEAAVLRHAIHMHAMSVHRLGKNEREN